MKADRLLRFSVFNLKKSKFPLSPPYCTCFPTRLNETLCHNTKFGGHTVHNSAKRVLLMEFHIGVSVTVLTSDYDAPDGSPAREIAKILLVGILCIELAGRNKLVVKVQVNMAVRLYKVLPLNA